MKREVRDKRHEYATKSRALRNVKFDEKVKKGDEVTKLMNEQDELYNKWMFFDKFIKADEKVRKG